MAKVVLARRARREILDLDWRLADAVEEALGALEREPESGYRLRGRLTGLWSLRIGSYRVLYQLAEEGETVRVLAVRHRSIVYRSDLSSLPITRGSRHGAAGDHRTQSRQAVGAGWPKSWSMRSAHPPPRSAGRRPD
ncbi:MAG TPA: type II toxin-antitoxin system RelE/ParE family toxin [Actinomycetota bacterium]